VKVESESPGRPPRTGVIDEVVHGAASPRYRITWDDGHESITHPPRVRSVLPGRRHGRRADRRPGPSRRSPLAWGRGPSLAHPGVRVSRRARCRRCGMRRSGRRIDRPGAPHRPHLDGARRRLAPVIPRSRTERGPRAREGRTTPTRVVGAAGGYPTVAPASPPAATPRLTRGPKRRRGQEIGRSGGEDARSNRNAAGVPGTCR
jgi:hypothetical protein